MELKVALTIDILAQLVRGHGTMREGASVTGRDCFQLKTAAGTYSVPTYEGFWAPCDFATFEASGSDDPEHFPNAVIEQAASDPELVTLLSQASIQWTAEK